MARWQGSLTEVPSLDLAADVTARALAERNVEPAQMDGPDDLAAQHLPRHPPPWPLGSMPRR